MLVVNNAVYKIPKICNNAMATDGKSTCFKLNEKVLKYEEYLNETVKVELQKVVACRDEVCNQISDYLQLRNMIENLKVTGQTEKPLKTMMDLGCSFYVQALVPDPSKICVNIGLGYYTELTIDESLSFIDKRVKSLEEISQNFTKDAVKIKAHIKLVLESLRKAQLIGDSPEELKQRQIF